MYVTYKDFKDHGKLLPDWYSEEIHYQILTHLSEESKLQAVKYLKEKAKEIDPENPHGALGLKECKDIVDSMPTVLAKLEQIRRDYDAELSTFIGNQSLIKETDTALIEKTIDLIEDGDLRDSILREVLASVPKTELIKIVEKYSP